MEQDQKQPEDRKPEESERKKLTEEQMEEVTGGLNIEYVGEHLYSKGSMGKRE